MSIKDFREWYGISRKELCAATGIPYRTLQKWECGERTPSSWVIGLVKHRIREIANGERSS